MKRCANQFLFSLFFLFIGAVTAQNEFQSGYIIDKEGRTIEGMIYNNGFYWSPDLIQFKEKGRSEIESLGPTDIKAFGFGTEILFISADISIDRAIDVNSGDAFISQENQFLRMISKSNSHQFLVFRDANKAYYFAGPPEGELKQLIKKVKVEPDGSERVYEYYQGVLSTLFSCAQIELEEYSGIDFDLKSLNRFFENFSACRGESTSLELFKSKPDGNKINWKLGLAYSFLGFSGNQGTSDLGDFELDLDPALQFSVEGELFTKASLERISFHFLLGYSSFKSKSTSTTSNRDVVTLESISEIEGAFGMRYHLSLGENIRWNTGAYLSYTAWSGPLVDFEQRVDFELPDFVGLGFQTGIVISGIQLEMRYPVLRIPSREIPFGWEVKPRRDFSIRASARVF